MKTAFLLLAAMALGGSASAAPVDSLNITPEEHAACDHDAISLCAFAYPDENQLLVCMKANRQKLSSVCQTAFVSGMKRRRIPLWASRIVPPGARRHDRHGAAETF